jgi:hypothetical protein
MTQLPGTAATGIEDPGAIRVPHRYITSPAGHVCRSLVCHVSFQVCPDSAVPIATMSSSLAACPRHILDLDLIETLTEQTTSACAFNAPLNTRMEYDLNSTCHGMDFTVQTALSLFIFPDLLFYPCLS